MAAQESVRCRRCWNMIDPGQAGLDGTCPICGAQADDFLPPDQRHRLFAPISSFSHIVARLQWDATVIDLAPDADAWPELPTARRERLTTLLAGFCVAEQAVSEHLTPFTAATTDTLVAWVFFLQRRDEERHALMFDRVAGEVLGLPGATPEERRAAAREHVTPELLELFEVRLPAVAAELANGSMALENGVSLYHMMLEGIVFAAGQRALLEDLQDGVLPGIHEGVRRVDLDERWHIGFGLRCLIDAKPPPDLITDLLAEAADAASAWGEAVPIETRRHVLRMCARRLAIAGLTKFQEAA